MMKKYLIRLFIFFSFMLVSLVTYSKTYTWSPKKWNPLISKVQLKNGTKIKLISACKFRDKKCQESYYGSTKQIVGITRNNQHREIIINHVSSVIEKTENIVAIEGYFGSKESAEFVIVSEHCNNKHELCNRTHTYLIVPEKTFFRKYYVGSNVCNITVNVNSENRIMDAKAVISISTGQYGKKRLSHCKFIKNLGFIDEKVKPIYVQLLSKHKYASDLFDEKIIRDTLVENMGLDRFRLLRKNTSWGGGYISSALKRYIVIEGSERYEWDNEMGTLIIDTFTGNSWWEILTQQDFKPIVIFGGTVEMPKEICNDFAFIKKYMNYHYEY